MVQATLPEFFSLLGVEATVGRTFSPDVETEGPMEVVLSHRYWQWRYGRSAEVLGSTVQINGHAAVIVGVLPAEYVIFGEGVDAWVAQRLGTGDQTTSGRWMRVLGRLAPGRSLDAVRDEMQAIAAGLEEEYPDFNGGWTVNVVPLKQQVVGDVRASLWILLGAVGLLLLVACANVANLFLVRGTERQKEMAVRTSLGASGSALAGQLLVESALIAVGGAVLGLGLAAWGTGTMVERMPDAFALPRLASVSVDGTVLGFTVLVTVATTILFGLLPAAQASGTSPAATLSAEGRGPSRRSGRARNALVVAEVALSVVLLAGAVLLGRSMMTLMAVDDGLEPEGVLVGRVNLSGSAHPSPEDKVAFFEELVGDVEALPGVTAAGAITFLPMDGLGAGTSFWPADRPMPPTEERPTADIRNVTGEYYRSMGIELLQGRTFDERDHRGAPQTVVVNRALAESQWPGLDPVGQQVVVNWVDHTPWEVVGVVEDVRMTGLAETPRESIYMHYAQATFFPWMHLTVRTRGDPTALAPSVRSVLRGLDPTLPLGSVRPMEEIVRATAARPRMTALLMMVFAGLATVLAAVGLYGVLAYAVSRRVREIGVRIAMGARPGTVLGMVIRQGASLAGVGLALGLGAALAGGRLLSSLLYEVEPSDPVSLLAAGAALFAVALMACAVPAWRASRVPPAEALRSD
jgi:putative ABC transport system permease protein